MHPISPTLTPPLTPRVGLQRQHSVVSSVSDTGICNVHVQESRFARSTQRPAVCHSKTHQTHMDACAVKQDSTESPVADQASFCIVGVTSVDRDVTECNEAQQCNEAAMEVSSVVTQALQQDGAANSRDSLSTVDACCPPNEETERIRELESPKRLFSKQHTVTLHRADGQPLGISVAAGKVRATGEQLDAPMEAAEVHSTADNAAAQSDSVSRIFVKCVVKNSPAWLNGDIKVGDCIIEVRFATQCTVAQWWRVTAAFCVDCVRRKPLNYRILDRWTCVFVTNSSCVHLRRSMVLH